jgi:hypothetical protein
MSNIVCKVGICPKCGKSFSIAYLNNADKVAENYIQKGIDTDSYLCLDCTFDDAEIKQTEEEWISLVQNMMDSGYDKEWAIRHAGPPPREGMEDEL